MAKNLKYRMSLEKFTNTAEEGYAEDKQWCFLKETWADMYVRSGGSQYAEDGQQAFTRVEFLFRYDEDITYECRIIYENQYYYINHIEPVDRKHWMKIISVNWEDKK